MSELASTIRVAPGEPLVTEVATTPECASGAGRRVKIAKQMGV